MPSDPGTATNIPVMRPCTSPVADRSAPSGAADKPNPSDAAEGFVPSAAADGGRACVEKGNAGLQVLEECCRERGGRG